MTGQMTAQLDMQDVVALALAALGMVLAWWLHHRLVKPSRCARCPLRPADE
jgi:hypothetical protein